MDALRGLCPDCLEVLMPSLDLLECPECHVLYVVDPETGMPRKPTIIDELTMPDAQPTDPVEQHKAIAVGPGAPRMADVDPPPPLSFGERAPGTDELTPDMPLKAGVTTDSAYAELLNSTPLEDIKNEVVRSIVERFRMNGRLSPKQASLIEGHVEASLAPPLARGPITSLGTVTKLRTEPAPLNQNVLSHVHVKLDDGNRLYVKVGPNDEFEVGDRVFLKATVIPSDDDAHFGFTRKATIRKEGP